MDSPYDFDFGVEEASAEMKNVFKNAPENTFWGCQRFYDRYTVDPNDWHWLDSSGSGVGSKYSGWFTGFGSPTAERWDRSINTQHADLL